MKQLFKPGRSAAQTCVQIRKQFHQLGRNALASRLALREGGEHKVSLDQVIATMYRTGLDMQTKYKETALGGLATLNIVEC